MPTFYGASRNVLFGALRCRLGAGAGTLTTWVAGTSSAYGRSEGKTLGGRAVALMGWLTVVHEPVSTRRGGSWWTLRRCRS